MKSKKITQPTLETDNSSLSDYEVNSKQLNFLFLSPPKGQEQKYSHLMDMYDAIPRFHWGRIERQKDIKGKLLPQQGLPAKSVDFFHRKNKYTLVLIPARIIKRDKNNKIIEEWEYYPQVREEIIEDTLRKMASEGKGAFFRKRSGDGIEEQTGVVFTIYALKKILAEYNHTYSYDEIKKSLLILRRTSLSIYNESGKQMVESNIFTSIGLSEENPQGNVFVLFNPLVTRSIQNHTFRQYNYKLAMGLRYSLSRWMYKRLCMNYTQASRMAPYTIMLSTILRDSHTKKYERISNNIREIEKTFKEFKDYGVIDNFEDLRVHDEHRKNKILDVKYIITPHADFIQDMRRFNAAFRDMREELL